MILSQGETDEIADWTIILITRATNGQEKPLPCS